ncbi:hypothetical protein [Pseudonocardia spinosispora]|uniref:hypothetical protein n=1 Tax=Pseudonocardia spinosispora TaxID=103441 RepID=UPI0012EC7F9B|nr:hypothetical protein [Pseudonocardia spinosispora]
MGGFFVATPVAYADDCVTVQDVNTGVCGRVDNFGGGVPIEVAANRSDDGVGLDPITELKDKQTSSSLGDRYKDVDAYRVPDKCNYALQEMIKVGGANGSEVKFVKIPQKSDWGVKDGWNVVQSPEHVTVVDIECP